MEPNRLVARRDELETIERFCAGASTGEGATALAISGPAGIGKTTVWRAGVERARSQGWRVLVAEAANREAALSFAGLGTSWRPSTTRCSSRRRRRNVVR